MREQLSSPRHDPDDKDLAALQKRFAEYSQERNLSLEGTFKAVILTLAWTYAVEDRSTTNVQSEKARSKFLSWVSECFHGSNEIVQARRAKERGMSISAAMRQLPVKRRDR